MSGQFDPYHKWLGIPADQQPPNFYKLLGLQDFESDPDVVEAAADQRMSHLRTYQSGKNANLSQKLLNEVSAARVTLLNNEEKRKYDQQLQQEQLQPPTSLLAPIVKTEPVRRHKRAAWILPAAILIGAVVALAAVIVVMIVANSNEDTRRETEVADSSASKPADQSNRGTAKDDSQSDPQTGQQAVGDIEANNSEATVDDSNQSASDDTDAGNPFEVIGKDLPTPATQPRFLEGSRAGEEISDNCLEMKFCWCPPGQFLMGSPASDGFRRPNEQQVQVTLTSGFWLGKYEVTQRQWRQLMGTEPWKGEQYSRDEPTHPVNYVNRADAIEFCRKLTEKERKEGRLGPDGKYKLPTEAEWEYACRAGSTARFCYGDDESQLAEYAWRGIRRNAIDAHAHPVGEKRPNAWGLHDTHGNVIEWCRDGYVEQLPGGTDPFTEYSEDARPTFRGGSWYNRAEFCRSTHRGDFFKADDRSSDLGFRVALIRDIPQTESPKLAVDDSSQADTITAAEPKEKQPIPSDEQQRPAIATLNETFALSKDRDADEQLKLAGELLALSPKSTDPVEKFVVLRAAMKLAGEGGDAELVIRVVNEIDKHFAIDRLEIGQKALLGFANTASSRPALESLVEATKTFTDQGLAQYRIDLAKELAEAVYERMVRSSAAAQQRKQAYDLRNRLNERYGQWKQVKDALDTLESNPGDPDANLFLGKWHCFEQNEWEAGFSFLMESNHEQLQALAERETSAPPETADQMVALGDAWWEAAEEESGQLQEGMRHRAAQWYLAAQPNVSSTLDKKKIEVRLAKVGPVESPLEPAATPEPQPDSESKEPAGEWIDVLALVDPERDRIGTSKWARTATTLLHEGDGRLGLPYNVGSNYDFHAEFIRTKGDRGPVSFVLPSGNNRTRLVLGGHNGQYDGLDAVDRANLAKNKTRRDSVLTTGRPFVIDVSVRTGGGETTIAVKINGQPYIAWKGKTSSLWIWSNSGVGGGNKIGLNIAGADVVFANLSVRKVSSDRPIE